MVFKDSTLLQEAYISAIQKSVNVPSDMPQLDNDNINPTVIDIEPNVPISNGCGCDEQQEEDYMALSNLFSIFSNAKKIHKFLESGINLEPWMQQKIAVCADNLESVMRSTHYDAAKMGVCD